MGSTLYQGVQLTFDQVRFRVRAFVLLSGKRKNKAVATGASTLNGSDGERS